VALITAAPILIPCWRIQKICKTLLRKSGRVYRPLAFDALHHVKFACHVLRDLSNFYCLPGRAGGSPNRLDGMPFMILKLGTIEMAERTGRWTLSLNPQQRFYNKCRVWLTAGQIKEYCRLLRTTS
jgi:hypothetical protein